MQADTAGSDFTSTAAFGAAETGAGDGGFFSDGVAEMGTLETALGLEVGAFDCLLRYSFTNFSKAGLGRKSSSAMSPVEHEGHLKAPSANKV